MTKSCCIKLGTDIAAATLLCLHILQSHWHCALQLELHTTNIARGIGKKIPTNNPKRAPTQTWIGVCPRTSFNLVSLTAWPSSRSSSKIFNTSACLPAWRRTPAASYMTIELKARLTANRELPRPNSIAVAVVTAEHRAECEDGMPPESTIAFKSHTPLRHRFVKILQVCAKNHPQKPAMNT